ncbi:MAG: hypothetical protein HY904_05185 [Deltaproteobacteria bacterium]|nr:hypothetical protein [Deltaproteobacteria bacterium]
MGVILTVLWHGAVAGACCYRARGWLEARDERLGIPFLVAAALALMVGTPTTIYLMRFHGAFFWHYLWDPSQHVEYDTYSFPASLGMMLVLAVATLVGWLAVRRTVDLMHPPYCLAPALTTAVAWVVLGAVFYERTLFVAAAPGAPALPLHQHRAGAMLAINVVGALIAVFASGRLFRDERSTQPPVRTSTLPG